MAWTLLVAGIVCAALVLMILWSSSPADDEEVSGAETSCGE
jgi:hypothetical protein